AEPLDGPARREEGLLTLDPAGQRAYWQGRDLGLKPKEYQLLDFLQRSRGRYAAAEELHAAVWGGAENRNIRTVTVHISGLRKKLRMVSSGQAGVDCSRTLGYRLELPGGERPEA
ncbi:MAG: winged helix-turn-helix domain-containing protein, partial [Eubacteriales bacterium]|nr:winged helix-turn-helix domain-containing protein [Eubacteriales bacterium]